MTREAPLEAHDLAMSYGSGRALVAAVRGVTLRLEAGEAVALTGPSGCGKTTLLRLLGLVVRPTGGRLLLGGVPAPTTASARAHLRNASIGFLHQDFALLESSSALDNVMIPLDYAVPRVPRKARRERALRALEDLGVGGLSHLRVDRLSGGERQRVALARALVNHPAVILAHEPTGALDSATAGQAIEQILGCRSRGVAVLIATHDMSVAARCDRVLSMRDGRLVG